MSDSEGPSKLVHLGSGSGIAMTRRASMQQMKAPDIGGSNGAKLDWATIVFAHCYPRLLREKVRQGRAVKTLGKALLPYVLRRVARRAKARREQSDVGALDTKLIFEEAPFVADWPTRLQRAFEDSFECITYDIGETIFTAGDVNNDFYIVGRGAVVVDDGDEAVEDLRMSMSQSDVKSVSKKVKSFGSLVAQRDPKRYTVTATEKPTIVWRCSYNKFDQKVCKMNPADHDIIVTTLVQHMFATMPEDFPVCARLFARVNVFKSYSEPTIDAFKEKFTPVVLRKGEIIVPRGHAAHVVVVLRGQCAAEVQTEVVPEDDTQMQRLDSPPSVHPLALHAVPLRTTPMLVGEHPFVLNSPQAKNIVVTSELVQGYKMLSVDFFSFLHSEPSTFLKVKNETLKRRAEKLELPPKEALMGIPLFSSFPASRLERLQRLLQPRCFDRTQLVIQGNSPTTEIYLVTEGVLNTEKTSAAQLFMEPPTGKGTAGMASPIIGHVGGSWEGLIRGRWRETWLAGSLTSAWVLSVEAFRNEFDYLNQGLRETITENARKRQQAALGLKEPEQGPLEPLLGKSTKRTVPVMGVPTHTPSQPSVASTDRSSKKAPTIVAGNHPWGRAPTATTNESAVIPFLPPANTPKKQFVLDSTNPKEDGLALKKGRGHKSKKNQAQTKPETDKITLILRRKEQERKLPMATAIVKVQKCAAVSENIREQRGEMVRNARAEVALEEEKLRHKPSAPRLSTPRTARLPSREYRSGYEPEPVEVLAFKLLHQSLVPAPPPFHPAHKFRYRQAQERATEELAAALGKTM